MSGTRHHILPQFLLKGFASRIEGEEVYAYTYRAEGAAFESNIRNTSVERHFYGKEGSVNADDVITREESRFAQALDDVRSGTTKTIPPDSAIVDFIGHLSSRTKHLRDSLIDSTDILLAKMFGYLSDSKRLNQWLKRSFNRNPGLINQEIVSQFGPEMAPLFKAIIPLVIESLDDSDLEGVKGFFDTLGAAMRQKLPDIARDGHIKALAKESVVIPRVEEYRKLKWRVSQTDTQLILADVGCVFEIKGSKRFKSLAGGDDEIVAIYLPVSSDTLVVGTASTADNIVATTELNEHTAKISREYFIASSMSAENERLQSLLGCNAEIIAVDEIEEILDEAFR